MEVFLADWAASVKDRDFVPACGDSSRDAAERFRTCLVDLTKEPGSVALVTHGGITVDLLRPLIGDDAVPVELMQHGVTSCAPAPRPLAQLATATADSASDCQPRRRVVGSSL
jgi:broad specificity phosphatase PhoE